MKNYRFLLLTGVFLFLVGCSTLDQLPAEGAVNPPCPAVYAVPPGFLSGDSGWTDHYVEIIGYTKDPFRVKVRENGETRYIENPRDCNTIIPGACFENYEEAKACMVANVSALYLTPSDMPGEGVPHEVPSSGSDIISGGTTYTQSAALPQVTKYVWEQPGGVRTEYPDEQSAMAAMNSSISGGRVFQIVEQPYANGSPPTIVAQWELGSLQPCNLPPGVSNPAVPYYKDTANGQYFQDVNAAVAQAKQRNGATTIMVYNRCVEGGVAVTVPGFTPPSGLDVSPSDTYYGVQLPGGNSWMFDANLSKNESEMFEAVSKSPGGGSIQPFVRGEPSGSVQTIPAWYPPPDWCQAVGAIDCTNPADVTIPVWYSVPLNTYYANKDIAVSATERFFSPGMPRLYPGGDVLLMSRGVPKTPESEEEMPLNVPQWQLPSPLPNGWDADRVYATYLDQTYESKKAAINISNENWWKWYLTAPKEKMSLYRRGVFLEEVGSPARFLLPLTILLSLWVLVSLLQQLVMWHRRATSGDDLVASAQLFTFHQLFAAFKTVLASLFVGTVFVAVALLAVRQLRLGNLFGFSLWGAGLIIVILFMLSLKGSQKFLRSLQKQKKRNHT